MVQTYGKDMLKDPFFRLLDKTFLLWHIGLGAVLLSVGWLCWDLRTGISLLVWGMFLRLVYVLHITWLVNSASHMWGYRNYETSDNSRNLWWVGLLAFGEGWHNNHHAFPGLRRTGHRWWEIDVTYLAILAMEKVGMAWKVIRVRGTTGDPFVQPARHQATMLAAVLEAFEGSASQSDRTELDIEVGEQR